MVRVRGGNIDCNIVRLPIGQKRYEWRKVDVIRGLIKGLKRALGSSWRG